MIKFIHKSQIHKRPQTRAFVVYYSVSDIILGLLLFSLVAFFAYNYLQEQLFSKTQTVYSNPANLFKSSK